MPNWGWFLNSSINMLSSDILGKKVLSTQGFNSIIVLSLE